MKINCLFESYTHDKNIHYFVHLKILHGGITTSKAASPDQLVKLIQEWSPMIVPQAEDRLTSANPFSDVEDEPVRRKSRIEVVVFDNTNVYHNTVARLYVEYDNSADKLFSWYEVPITRKILAHMDYLSYRLRQIGIQEGYGFDTV